MKKRASHPEVPSVCILYGGGHQSLHMLVGLTRHVPMDADTPQCTAIVISR